MIVVRHAKRNDVRRIYELITGLAKHHDQEQFVLTDPDVLLEAGFGPESLYGVLLAEEHGKIIGFLSFTLNYSIWLGNNYMNIDDVFVESEYRGRNIGERLMIEAKAHCLEMGLSRIRWEVQSDNKAAIRFYTRLGAQMVEKGIFSWDLK